jgi:hypothetical protein
MISPRLGEACRLRELFVEVFSIADPEEAKGYLKKNQGIQKCEELYQHDLLSYG